MTDRNPSRRSFLRNTTLAAAGTAAAWTTGPSRAASPPPAEEPKPKKTKIRIGMRIHRGWLESENDDELRFLKQVGVDYADITLDMIDGYRQRGRFRANRRQVWSSLPRHR